MNLEKLNLIELDTRELKETDGGLLWLLVVPATTVLAAAGATLLAAGVALIQNQLDKK
ncbi:hypothetical protein [Flavobacterium sp.]|uniref:hypothetical protein n=1 Tax=Flavobacterium sp. TaxID=239 RepID=UPI00261F723A|nr:hypothetical protein [Flavobacterium sp.]